jgi:hypothetical protein
MLKYLGVKHSLSTLREDYRLRMVKNRVLRKTYGSGREEMTGDWSKLHNEKLNHWYSS